MEPNPPTAASFPRFDAQAEGGPCVVEVEVDMNVEGKQHASDEGEIGRDGRLKGGFLVFGDSDESIRLQGSCCLFLCSPLCIPLTVPCTLLGWLWYPVSCCMFDTDAPDNCCSMIATYLLCYLNRCDTCFACVLCCPYPNYTLEEIIEAFGPHSALFRALQQKLQIGME
uniref:Uncharacterized protein n=1 Tax=Lotharella globosa TaxID=91324 RepID=A0A7S4DQT3_9EUKA